MDELRYRRAFPEDKHGYTFFVTGPPRMIDEDFTAAFATVHQWCAEQFGVSIQDADDDSGLWGSNTMGDVWIRRETDATAFRVRWC